MNIPKPNFDILEAKYGGFGSWAIWDPADPRSTDIIRESICVLDPSIVMVGLNISAPLEHPWSNFHIGRNGRKLEHAFNQGGFQGSYITDIVKGEGNGFESTSG